MLNSIYVLTFYHLSFIIYILFITQKFLDKGLPQRFLFSSHFSSMHIIFEIRSPVQDDHTKTLCISSNTHVCYFYQRLSIFSFYKQNLIRETFKLLEDNSDSTVTFNRKGLNISKTVRHKTLNPLLLKNKLKSTFYQIFS